MVISGSRVVLDDVVTKDLSQKVIFQELNEGSDVKTKGRVVQPERKASIKVLG